MTHVRQRARPVATRSTFLATTLLPWALLLGCQGLIGVGAVESVATPATQSLQWSQLEQTIDVPWDAKTVSASFTCTNSGAAPIRLTVDSSCGCLATAPEPNPVPAGATGTLQISMPVGFRSGLVTKSILVRTDQVGVAPTNLQLRLNIPNLAEIRPSFVHWQIGDAARVQVVQATIQPGFPVTFTGIKASESVLSAVWEPNAARTSGRLLITPKSTALPWNGTVVLLTDAGRDFVIFCRCIAPDTLPAGPKYRSDDTPLTPPQLVAVALAA